LWSQAPQKVASSRGLFQLDDAGTVVEHRSASAVDLVIAATAAHHGLAVLHGDADYRAIARHATDLLQHNVYDIT